MLSPHVLAQRVAAAAEAHPLRVSVTGATSGLFTWFVTHAEGIKLFFQIVGGGLGALLTAISLLLVMPRFARFLGAWWRRGFLDADK